VNSHELLQSVSVDETIQFDVTRSELESCAGFIESQAQRRSQFFDSDPFIESDVFTGSIYFTIIDEQSEQTINNSRQSAAVSTSAGAGLFGLAAIVILLLKKRNSKESEIEEGMEYDTEGRDVNMEEEDSGDDDDWDIDEFDRVIESTFVNGQEPSHVMYDVSDHLFPTDCDELS
jgi:hypothetical protein